MSILAARAPSQPQNLSLGPWALVGDDQLRTVDGSGAVAGHPWDRPDSSPAPIWEETAAHVGRVDLTRLDGSFCAFAHDAATGGLWAATDRLGSKQLYRAVGPTGVTAVGTDPAGVAAAVHAPLRLDLMAVWQWLCFGYIPSSRTLLEGLRLLPPGTWVNVETGASERYWLVGGRRDRLPPEASHETLLALQDQSVERALAAVPGTPLVKLSGGWDSRAVLVRLVEAGAAPMAVTFARGDTRDRHIAAAVAADLGVPHIVRDYNHDIAELRRLAHCHADLTDNLFSTMSAGPSQIAGLPGQAFWTGTDLFSGGVPLDYPTDDVVHAAVSYHSLPPLVVEALTGGAAVGLEDAFAEVENLARTGGEAMHDAHDRLSVELSFRRWSTSRSLHSREKPVVSPWCSVDVIEFYGSLPIEQRHSRRAHIEANRNRYQIFRDIEVWAGAMAQRPFRPVLEDTELRSQMLAVIADCPEISALIDPGIVARADAVGWGDQLYLGVVVARLFMMATVVDAFREALVPAVAP